MKKMTKVPFERTRTGYVHECLKGHAGPDGWVDVSKVHLPCMTRKVFAAELRALRQYGLYRAGGFLI